MIPRAQNGGWTTQAHVDASAKPNRVGRRNLMRKSKRFAKRIATTPRFRVSTLVPEFQAVWYAQRDPIPAAAIYGPQIAIVAPMSRNHARRAAKLYIGNLAGLMAA